MDKETLLEKLKESYGFLFEDALLEEISTVGVFKSVKENDILIEVGEVVDYMPLLFTGAIKILREDKDGDELLLYFIERGDTCAMTMTCCIGNSKSEIRAVAEADTELVSLPVAQMENWLTKYKSWRNFVFESYNVRLNEMLEAIDSLAFMRMDERLYRNLMDKVKINGTITIRNTHQEIANELHTSRVVISRLLKKLEIDEKIKLYRNRIEILNY